jgi:hypothetical protein
VNAGTGALGKVGAWATLYALCFAVALVLHWGTPQDVLEEDARYVPSWRHRPRVLVALTPGWGRFGIRWEILWDYHQALDTLAILPQAYPAASNPDPD